MDVNLAGEEHMSPASAAAGDRSRDDPTCGLVTRAAQPSTSQAVAFLSLRDVGELLESFND
jgi:hypothetical protein